MHNQIKIINPFFGFCARFRFPIYTKGYNKIVTDSGM